MKREQLTNVTTDELCNGLAAQAEAVAGAPIFWGEAGKNIIVNLADRIIALRTAERDAIREREVTRLIASGIGCVRARMMVALRSQQVTP